MKTASVKTAQVIKEKNPAIAFSSPVRKTVLLCLNGFQNQDTHDSLPMKEYFESQFQKDRENCEIHCVQLFMPAEKKTHHHAHFERALRQDIESYIRKGYDIQLLGYSFSAALAAKMCHRYRKNISRVIFVAPVYDTIFNHMISGYLKYAWKFHKLAKKYGSRMAKTMGRQTTKGLMGLLVSIFSSILLNRHYFRNIRCDTLLIRGDADTLCTEHSLKKVRSKLRGENVLYLYPGLTHGILKNVKLNGIVYEDILHFSFNTPFILEKSTKEIDAIRHEEVTVYYDEDGEPIPTFGEIFHGLDPDADTETRLDQEGL